MTDSSDAKFWEETYVNGDYLNHWDYEFPSQELVAAVAILPVKADSVALDIGCGAGREAIFLAQCGFRVIAVDISQRALEIARERATAARVDVSWRQGDFCQMPIEAASIDFVNDRGAFHLVPESDRPRFVADVFRVMKPGGVMILRGASSAVTEEGFTPITEESVDRHFPAEKFLRGPVLPITLVSDGGTLDGMMVALKKL